MPCGCRKNKSAANSRQAIRAARQQTKLSRQDALRKAQTSGRDRIKAIGQK
jgi:hypothetical protein